MIVTTVHAASKRLAKFHARPLATFIDHVVLRVGLGIVLPHTVTIGPGTRFPYGGLGVVVHRRVTIGERVLISPGVVIGGSHGSIAVPRIGDDVILGSGAKVLGDVSIGAGSVVGANSVVLTDVPPASLVVGAPARVVRTDIDSAEYR